MFIAQTLGTSFTLDGIGLHSGTRARVTAHPRGGGGRVFVSGGVEIPALVENVADTRRCTTLAREGQQVQTVEHLLAALWLADIDHAEIVVEGPELPALDGSARCWYDAVRSAGVRAVDNEAPALRIVEMEWYQEDHSQFFICPSAELALFAAISIPDTVAMRMMAGGAVGDESVREQLLRARTFGLESEVQALLDAGLAHGGSLDNAVVLTRDGYLNERVWPNEPAWHKALDLAGDLALIGARLYGQVLAVRAGHHAHVKLAQRLRSAWLAEQTSPGRSR